MKKPMYVLIAGAALAAIAFGLLTAPDRALGQQGDAKASDRKADEEAIRKASDDLSAAITKGDAKALANLWTEEGEYIAEKGTTLQGREAIEKAYAEHLGKDPRTKIELGIDSIRFVSRDSAVVEGHARSQRGNTGQPSNSRYSALRVRENGNWLIALLREWPDEGTTLRDLDWLIGTWTAKTDGSEISTTYEWDEAKKFIHCRFTIKKKDSLVFGTQFIGKDPRTGNLRSWLFEGGGGFGEAQWSWDGKRWLQDATGVEADGDEITATNILMPLGKDSFTWQSVNRTENGESVPDIHPIKVSRVK
jgi:uncharacterized protein (TIGR02246 family)